ncbi:hypothetical protein PoB_002820400 [Plakobranchus ocellatus]|uniref:Uncharacterized protein n=1 Tax=Plakobranchus ocellatus TaxID=259542 RepID=A0AAV4A251_9GAST|nr:hypothetical protein PoB_002820400 [Plakobranchus ocellatus]
MIWTSQRKFNPRTVSEQDVTFDVCMEEFLQGSWVQELSVRFDVTSLGHNDKSTGAHTLSTVTEHQLHLQKLRSRFKTKTSKMFRFRRKTK